MTTNPDKTKDSGICFQSPFYGADEGNRTLNLSLGSSYFTTKLHPHGSPPATAYLGSLPNQWCRATIGIIPHSGQNFNLYFLRVLQFLWQADSKLFQMVLNPAVGFRQKTVWLRMTESPE